MGGGGVPLWGIIDAYLFRVICRRLTCQTIVAIFIYRRRSSHRHVFCHIFSALCLVSTFQFFFFRMLSVYRLLHSFTLVQQETPKTVKNIMMHLLIAAANMSRVRQRFFFHFCPSVVYVFMDSSHGLCMFVVECTPEFVHSAVLKFRLKMSAHCPMPTEAMRHGGRGGAAKARGR